VHIYKPLRPDLCCSSPVSQNVLILEMNCKFTSWFMYKCKGPSVLFGLSCSPEETLGSLISMSSFRDESGKVNTKDSKHHHQVQLAFLFLTSHPGLSCDQASSSNRK